MRTNACLAFACLLAGCGGSPMDGGPDLAMPDLGPRSTYTAAEAAAARAACTFGPGTAPGLSLAKDAPLGPEIPIDTIVVVMMENRSFDHALGALPAVGVTDVDVAAANVTNPDANGMPVQRYHETRYCFYDTNHEWDGSHLEWNNGKNDGFVLANQGGLLDPVGKRGMGYYDQNDLPFRYGLAANYAIGDRYFCSVLGPTYPNREYLYAGTSFGYTFNELIQAKKPTLFTALSDAGVDWRVYSTSSPGPAIFIGNYSAAIDHFFPIAPFFDEAQAGTLAPVTFVDPDLTAKLGFQRDDDHPPGSPQAADKFLEKVVKAVTASPQWPHTALIITWDEHGGLYDHVPPPEACAPDDIAPFDEHGPATGDFKRLGFRVPLIVVSPYARPKFVSHTVYDHTSVTRFIEARFLLGALTKRDANADPLSDLFDFAQPKLLTPPPLPAAVYDPAKQDQCANELTQAANADGGAPNDGGM